MQFGIVAAGCSKGVLVKHVGSWAAEEHDACGDRPIPAAGVLIEGGDLLVLG